MPSNIYATMKWYNLIDYEQMSMNKTLNYTQNGITTNFVVAAARVPQILMKAFLCASKFTKSHVTRNNKQN